MANKKAATPDDIKKARTFLKARKLLDVFSPRMFATAQKEISAGLDDTLRYLANLQSGGQGLGPFPDTAEALRNEGTA